MHIKIICTNTFHCWNDFHPSKAIVLQTEKAQRRFVTGDLG